MPNQSVIHIELLMQVSGEKAAENGISCAPIIHHDHGKAADLRFLT